MGEPLPVELMNTVWADRTGVHDALASAADTRAWLAVIADREPLAAAGGGEPLAGRLRELRDAARRLAAVTTDDPRAAAASPLASRTEAVELLNRVAALSPRRSRLHWPEGGSPARTFAAAGGADDALLSALAEQTIELFAGDERARLRACLAPGCVLYFAGQHPRREWCSAACGNRARVARHYRRHHGDGCV
jgi:predicted RNA-binding Zn ribbon-like protein